MSNSNNRDASPSMNGYFYQRYCCVYYILNKQNFEYVMEEGYEDIDFININNNRDIIQVKYCGDKKENLLDDSGLYKVICANFEKNDINTITYLAYNTTKEIYDKKILYLFNNKKYYDIGIYILLIIYKKNTKGVIKNNIDVAKIVDIYEKYKDDINKLLNSIDEYKKLYLFFSKKNNCDNYFSKFRLEKGKSYNNLINDINNEILRKYNNYIKESNDDMKQIKLFYIRSILFECLTKTMFNNKTNSERSIKYSDINKEIIDKLDILLDKDNLCAELLKINANIIIQHYSDTQKISIESIELINEFKNNYKQFNVLDIVSFLICFLNKYQNKFSNDLSKCIFDIKIFIIDFLITKYNNVDINNKTKFIKYLSLISSKINKRYKIPHIKLFQIINEEYIPNNFFHKY
jgi:hypothetical protein